MTFKSTFDKLDISEGSVAIIYVEEHDHYAFINSDKEVLLALSAEEAEAFAYFVLQMQYDVPEEEISKSDMN